MDRPGLALSRGLGDAWGPNVMFGTKPLTFSSGDSRHLKYHPRTMGFLNFTSKSKAGGITRLPSGCFTVDRNGRILISTLPQSFPQMEIQKIADMVLSTFRNANQARLVFTEFQVRYPALKLTARDLKGGALVFLTPQTRS